MDIKDYWIKKFIFPKKIIISEPGIIINQISRRYGGIKSQQRSIFYSENIIIDLQLETARKIGKEKSVELWYRIGKDIGTRYMLLAKMKTPPTLLVPLIVNYIFMGLKTGGQSFCEKIDFNQEKEKLELKGSHNMICRKTGNNGFTRGFVSAIMSTILGKNIEVRGDCDCPNKCKIFLDKNCKSKYIPNAKELAPHEAYDKLNFPPSIKNKKNKCSLENIIKFKKIEYKNNKVTFKNNVLVPGEIGMIGIIYKHYCDNNLKDMLGKSVIKTSERICKNITIQSDTPKQKLDKILRVLCTMGYGVPTYKFTENGIEIISKHIPYSKYGFYTQDKILNGFVNSIFEKKFTSDKVKFNKFNSQAKFHYT